MTLMRSPLDYQSSKQVPPRSRSRIRLWFYLAYFMLIPALIFALMIYIRSILAPYLH
jgi:hypothetical protein